MHMVAISSKGYSPLRNSRRGGVNSIFGHPALAGGDL